MGVDRSSSIRRRAFGGTFIAGLATVLALWIGFKAPTVSPVTPVPVAQPAPATPAQQNAGTADNTAFDHGANDLHDGRVRR